MKYWEGVSPVVLLKRRLKWNSLMSASLAKRIRLNSSSRWAAISSVVLRSLKRIFETGDIPQMDCFQILFKCLFDRSGEDWQSQMKMHGTKRFWPDRFPT